MPVDQRRDRRSSAIRSRFWQPSAGCYPAACPEASTSSTGAAGSSLAGAAGSVGARLGGRAGGVIVGRGLIAIGSVGRGLVVTGVVGVGHISGPAPFLVVSETTFDGGADPPSFVAMTR